MTGVYAAQNGRLMLYRAYTCKPNMTSDLLYWRKRMYEQLTVKKAC